MWRAAFFAWCLAKPVPLACSMQMPATVPARCARGR